MTPKKPSLLLCLALPALLLYQRGLAQLTPADTIKTKKGNIIIQPIFHMATVLTLGTKTIYLDPYNGSNAYRGLPAPDLILITDIHGDHLDTATLHALNPSKARFIVPQAVAEKLPQRFREKATVINNGSSTIESGITITAIPMYNLPEEPTARHTKGRGNGYVLEFGGKRIYFSGDTEDIREMRDLKNIDIAFVCMNQPFTMTVQQAASAVLEFKPKIVYPFHYRNMNGFSDVQEFKKIVSEGNKSIEVRLKDWYRKILSKAKVTKHENIVYGMVSGASLTMDIYQPEKSNNLGIITIPGTAFGYAYSAEYSQNSMTANFVLDSIYFGKSSQALLDRGYTLFVINHRLAPQFRWQDILGDCQRAVRFVRFNAKKYNIDPANIGAFGYSSGATLASMLGVTDWDKSANQKGVDAESSKVQSVVTLAARFNLSDFNKKEDIAIQNPIITRVLMNYMGELPQVENGNYSLTGKYAEASPITHVDKGDATFLIYASLDDPLVPHRQQSAMHKKLTENGIETKLNLANNQGHNPIPDMDEVDRWFFGQLKK